MFEAARNGRLWSSSADESEELGRANANKQLVVVGSNVPCFCEERLGRVAMTAASYQRPIALPRFIRCESRLDRFPLVFYGHEDPHLADGDYRAFARSAMEHAADRDRDLARAYAAAGDPPNPMYFDDRSVPFAIGSLSYSRSITQVARLWLTAWERAGGDVGRTPYRGLARDNENTRSP